MRLYADIIKKIDLHVFHLSAIDTHTHTHTHPPKSKKKRKKKRRIIKSIARPLHSQHNEMKIPEKDFIHRDFLLFVLHLSGFKTYLHSDA
jgi:hypothetical protein